MSLKSIGTLLTGFNEFAATGKLTESTINSLKVATESLSGAQIAAALSTSKLNAQQIVNVITTLELDEAQEQAILSALGLSTAQGTATVATNTFTASIAAATKGLIAFLTTNPVGWAILAAGAIFGLVKAFDFFTLSAEEATEKMEKSVSAFEEATSQLESLNKELETTKARIDELEAKDSLTFVEESELKKLRESVELLRIEADLADKKQAREAKDVADDTITAYRKNFKHDISADAIKEYLDTSTSTGNNAILFSDENNVAAMLAGIEQMRRLRDGLDKSSEYYAEDYQHFQGVIDDATGSLWDQVTVLKTYKANLEAIPYSELSDEQKQALDEINAAIKLVYTSLDPAKWNQMQWDGIVDSGKFDNDIQKLNDLAAQGEVTAETFKKQFPDLAKACEDADVEISGVVDNLNAAFEKADESGVSSYTAKLSSLTDVLSDLKSAYDVLDSAEEDMASGEGVSADTIAALAKAEENYLDYLYEENGVIKLNTEAWKENANAKMLGEMDEIQKEIDSIEAENAALQALIDEYKAKKLAALESQDLSTYYSYDSSIDSLTAKIQANNEVIAENQGKLAIYSSLYGSVTGDLDAYASALQNFSHFATTIDGITSSFQTLADLQAQVANGFTMSLDKALEFAKVYPEILNSATVAADGQITLNENVVNSFIEGKKAELDAGIDAMVAELQGEKAKYQAKIDMAQAQLDLAKAVAEGEGDISKELAEYRINAGNAVAQALIDAGIDEATAFKLAAAAMAQNAEEFDRVAMEVCTDVNGNFNQAAYNLAQTMYNNLTNVKENLADVATQAHQTALAIAGIASGDVQGSSEVVGGSGGGVAGSGIKLNLTSGSFKETDYTYTAKESNLEDFISQIELDISNYQNAISHIDGQIAALQALKNAPLKSFKSSGSGGSGSGGSSKEVDEYIASIDEYRDAVERLRKAQEEAERLESEIENAGSYEKKIALQKELIGAYQDEQAALHDLNNARDATITQSVDSLRELGFAVEYNADTNDLWISNLEHLNELTADSKGEYGSLQEATNALREGTEDLINTITDLNDANREGSATWQELNRQIIETTISMYENANQARKNAITLAENGMSNAIDTKNLDDVKKFSAAIIAEYEGMQQTLHEEAEYYRSQGYSDTSDEVSDLSDLWWDYADNIKDVKQQVVDYLIDIVDAASNAVDEIQNVSDTLYEAADEFAANDGFITVDTYQALLALGPQYMQMLRDENGLWQINEERINDVIAARTRQLAVENAMSYVERIKLAAQKGSIEDLNNLVFATTDATSSTWGLVYAELELMHIMGDLNDSQYQAALHNIQAMQDLAENAVQNIGRATDSVATNLEETRKQLEATKKGLQDTLDELEEMQKGAGDLVDYVMEMLKHRIRQQIDLLEEMKDKYSEIIALKKESLDATKDEQDYQKTIAKKLKEMAKLQERINALSLDDSRSAQAERAKLLEEMAELQEDLSDTQADKAIEVTKDSLDKMEDEYHAEKDKEIEILENSISSTQKLYDMAIDYIRNNWDTLYSELIAWNTEYGSDLNTEITAAWEAAQAAAQRYGDFVTAIMGGISAEIDNITKQIEALDEQMSNLDTSTTGGGGGLGGGNPSGEVQNTVVGNVGNRTELTKEDQIAVRVREMYQNSKAWHSASESERERLNKRNLELGAQLNALEVSANRDEASGTWYSGGELLFEKFKRYLTYHTGGFVGKDPLKPNEQYIKVENGELVLTDKQQDSLAAQIEQIDAMTDMFKDAAMLPPTPTVGGGMSQAERSTINNITNNSRPIEVRFGDTIIHGNASPETVRQHEQVSEKMVNDFARLLGVKW